MKKHLVISLLGYMYFGFGLAVQQFGIKAGLGFWPTVIIFVSSVIFFLIVGLTSLEKVKTVLFKEDNKNNTPKFDFEETTDVKTPTPISIIR